MPILWREAFVMQFWNNILIRMAVCVNQAVPSGVKRTN